MTLEEKLVAKGQVEELLKKYVIFNASDALTEKILSDGYSKNISDAFNYIKKVAQSKASNNCAFLSDDEVYGLLMHYLEEDSLNKETQVPSAKVTTGNSKKDDKKEVKKEEVKKKEPSKPQKQPKVEERQESLFDFM